MLGTFLGHDQAHHIRCIAWDSRCARIARPWWVAIIEHGAVSSIEKSVRSIDNRSSMAPRAACESADLCRRQSFDLGIGGAQQIAQDINIVLAIAWRASIDRHADIVGRRTQLHWDFRDRGPMWVATPSSQWTFTATLSAGLSGAPSTYAHSRNAMAAATIPSRIVVPRARSDAGRGCQFGYAAVYLLCSACAFVGAALDVDASNFNPFRSTRGRRDPAA